MRSMLCSWLTHRHGTICRKLCESLARQAKQKVISACVSRSKCTKIGVLAPLAPTSVERPASNHGDAAPFDDFPAQQSHHNGNDELQSLYGAGYI